MISYRWFILPALLLGFLYIYESTEYLDNEKIVGIVERVYIHKNTGQRDSEKVLIRFNNVTDSQSVGPRAFRIIKPGDKIIISSGRVSGAWMEGDVYRSNKLIHKDLKFNRPAILILGLLLFLFPLVGLLPLSWLGGTNSRRIKHSIMLFGTVSTIMLVYYLLKIVKSIITG